MPDNICANHTGHEEKISGIKGKLNIVMTMMTIMITLMVGLGGALYNSAQTTSSSLATVAVKMTVMEEKFRVLENVDNKLETKIENIKVK